jgi:hypothetical protein
MRKDSSTIPQMYLYQNVLVFEEIISLIFEVYALKMSPYCIVAGPLFQALITSKIETLILPK